MSRSGSRRSGFDNSGLIPILARKVREVEAKAATGKKVGPTNRTKFQVIAFLVREERARSEARLEAARQKLGAHGAGQQPAAQRRGEQLPRDFGHEIADRKLSHLLFPVP